MESVAAQEGRGLEEAARTASHGCDLLEVEPAEANDSHNLSLFDLPTTLMRHKEMDGLRSVEKGF